MNCGQAILTIIQSYVGRCNNMKKFLSLLLLSSIFTLASCGGGNDIDADISVPTNNGSSTDTGEVSQDPDDGVYDKLFEYYAHFLVFEVDGSEIARMLTLPTDTYDSLAPYFPAIPEQIGYDSYWERIDNVYEPNVRLITIVAYYSKR